MLSYNQTLLPTNQIKAMLKHVSQCVAAHQLKQDQSMALLAAAEWDQLVCSYWPS